MKTSTQSSRDHRYKKDGSDTQIGIRRDCGTAERGKVDTGESPGGAESCDCYVEAPDDAVDPQLDRRVEGARGDPPHAGRQHGKRDGVGGDPGPPGNPCRGGVRRHPGRSDPSGRGCPGAGRRCLRGCCHTATMPGACRPFITGRRERAPSGGGFQRPASAGR